MIRYATYVAAGALAGAALAGALWLRYAAALGAGGSAGAATFALADGLFVLSLPWSLPLRAAAGAAPQLADFLTMPVVAGAAWGAALARAAVRAGEPARRSA